MLKYLLLYFLLPVSVNSCYIVKDTGPLKSEDNLKETTSRFLVLVNEIRSKGAVCGATKMPEVEPLVQHDLLNSVAYEHSRYMDSTNRMSHTGKNKSTPSSRLDKAGYLYYYMAENIAYGAYDEAEVFQIWIKSSGHCKTIMDSNAKKLGFGSSGKYWTMVVASP